ncbi:rhamnosyltransferase [Ruminococcaceae bacterium KH2T8]|nr:rhamnosyltransferase [Ruminococcaceae bacterium KH2T8]
MKKVLIMLACYNGGKYIGEQIESIIGQTYSDFELVIQDDGSTDETIDIVKAYCDSDSRITLRINDTQYHGAFLNFHILANLYKNANNFDYYMFSDQDDIWDKNKIETMVQFLEKNTQDDVPSLVYADMRTIDQNKQMIESSIDNVWKISGKNKCSYFFSHKVFGCNLMMNAALFNVVPYINPSDFGVRILSHDNLYAKFAATLGEVYFIDEQLMSYRRHGGNQTTEQQYRISIKRILQRLFGLHRLAEKHACAYNQTMYAIKLLRTIELDADQISFVNDIDFILRHKGFKSLFLINQHKVKWGGLVENTSHKLIIFLGMHLRFLELND